jgi:hypothetical protein
VNLHIGDNRAVVADLSAVIDGGDGSGRLTEARYWRAQAEAASGDDERALADYSAILETPEVSDDDRGDALLERARVKDKTGDDAGAMADIASLVGMDGGSSYHLSLKKAEALLWRGQAKSREGDATGAEEDFDAVLQMEDVTDDLKTRAQEALDGLEKPEN